MRLFSYACKAKEVKKFLSTHKILFQFLLKEYSKNHPTTMNNDAERRCRKCMPEQEKALALA